MGLTVPYLQSQGSQLFNEVKSSLLISANLLAKLGQHMFASPLTTNEGSRSGVILCH